MGNFKGEDLTNKKFNKLTVLAWSGETYWLCVCECGGFTKARKRGLTSGHRYSCGCETRCGDGNRKTTDEFIAATKDRGINHLFDYSDVNYHSSKEKVKIGCLKHQTTFLQTPSEHLKGSGCPSCISEKLSSMQRKPIEDFVKDARGVHGEHKYSYERVEYLSNKVKVEILCNSCGNHFWQTPDSHMRGHGCPTCAEHGFDPKKRSILYILAADNMTKIGITNRSASDRLKTVNFTSAANFKVFAEYEVEGRSCERLESALLKYFKTLYKNPSTKFDGYTETLVGLLAEDAAEVIECLI